MINNAQICHTNTCAHALSQLQNKGTEAEREGERGRRGKDDMTFMISGTIWSKELQRQKEQIRNTAGRSPSTAFKCLCMCVCVCVINGGAVKGKEQA